MKILAVLPLFLLLSGCNSKAVNEQTESTTSKAKVGSPAPQFSLKSTSGKTVQLSDHKGKVVLLDFWATWCPPCRISTPILVRLNEKYKGKNLSIIGISLDEDHSDVPAYLEDENVKHEILYGDGSIESDYKVRAIPTFYLLDANGIVVKQYEGFHPALEEEWEKEVELLLAKK